MNYRYTEPPSSTQRSLSLAIALLAFLSSTIHGAEVDAAKDLPRYPTIEPNDAVATWKIKQGFKLELAAHEPQVRSPVAITFDEHGRMFVCEMIDYSERRDAKPHQGRVSMLEDKDGNGVYESSTVFADNLPWPTGLIWANGGLYVIATPDILFFKDTQGAGKADVREVVFTGFGTRHTKLNVQGLPNSLQWGQDNRIHLQTSSSGGGKIKCLKRPELGERDLGGHDFWFDPLTYDFGFEAGGGQFGMSFDDYGRRFVCANSDHLQHFVYDERYQRNPFFQLPASRQSIAADGGAAEVFRISPDEPWRIVRTRWRVAGVVKGVVEGGGRVSGYFTGASGTTVYRGDAYGQDFVNNTFTGDAGGQLVHRKRISQDGVSLIGKRPDDEQNFEFAASTDTWVRVVNFANAPDGCLYVIDMYREVIEHPWSIPEEIKKHLDLNSGNNRGRIYRIVPDRAAWKRRSVADLSLLSTENLVRMLESPNGWHRDTASRLIYERRENAAVPAIQKIARESQSPAARLHALGALDGLGVLDEDAVLHALADDDAFVRERAIVLCEKFVKGGECPVRLAVLLDNLLEDPSARMRFQLALTLGSIQGSNPILEAAYIHLATTDYADLWISAALLSAPPEVVTGALFQRMTEDPALAKSAAAFVAKLIEIHAASKPADCGALIDFIASGEPNPLWLRALGEGLRRAGTNIEKADPARKLDALFARAASSATDAGWAPAARLDAVELLGFSSAPKSHAALAACLSAGQSDEIQAAAIKILARNASADATRLFLEKWPHFGAKAKDAALTAFLQRGERTTSLLEAVMSGVIKPDEFSAAQVQNLLLHKDVKIAALAKSVLAKFIPASRAEMLAKYKTAASMKGDAINGQKQFATRCVTCHRAAGLGVQVGPDLVTVKNKGRDALLLAILDPNKEVAAQYVVYDIKTNDGLVLSGMIVNDSASGVTLRRAGAADETIPRNRIKRMSSSGLSLMPEGIEAGASSTGGASMDLQSMVDLLTFIEELK